MVPINRMAPRSFVTNIASSQQVKSGAPTTLRGIAFGGDCGVGSGAYSLHRGKSRHQAQLGKDEGNYGFPQWQSALPLPSPAKCTILTRSPPSTAGHPPH